MANKSKISIKPMNNAAAIASTLGIGTSQPKEESISKTVTNPEKTPAAAKKEKITADSPKKSKGQEIQIPAAEDKNAGVSFEAPNPSILPTQETNKPRIAPVAANSPVTEMPLLIDIKRKFPGKELYILSLLYLQRNGRGLVQMTVGNMMALYSSVFQDVIKDDTVRRSLKRLSDAGFIKTTGIPGNNSGYIYEIGDLLESELLSVEEKEEFAELNRFVKGKLG